MQIKLKLEFANTTMNKFHVHVLFACLTMGRCECYLHTFRFSVCM